MGKRRTRPLPGDRKFHAPKAKRVLQEAPGAAGSAVPIPSQSSDPEGDPARMDTPASEDGEADPKGIPVGEHGAGSPQEERDKEIRGGGAPESPEQGVSDEMEEKHLELPQLGILEADGTGGDELESPNPGILDGAGENCPESPKPEVLEVDGEGEEPPEPVKCVILDGVGQNHLESSQLGILEGNGAGEEQLDSPQLRIPEVDGAGEEQLESLKLRILDGTVEDQLESPKPGISEVVGAAEEQLETPTHRILDGTGEEHPESVKPGIPEVDEASEEQPEPLKQGIWDGAGHNQRESPEQGNSGASSPEDTVTATAPAESSEAPDAAAEREGGALEEGRGTGIAPSVDTASPEGPGDPQGGNSSVETPGLHPAATSTEPRDQREGTSPELPTEKPWDAAGQIHSGSAGNSPVQPRESARATEPADASDVICGLIRELSDLNRLAMGARRGLELLRRPKPRRGRRPVPSGSRWKEG
ncbi:guanine nucleotide-binding protein G(s) subunit alpha isoforms XLas-like isoform X2 [Hirundo rustica]|uniref:guanine nucleotide-binding protein G(s) subunit alpha isoforms XLas-like isoform X2 n=1 Tax=Hirundo rustica TaxID=43150 RepID=UPI001A948A91|nr:guanine nucleotide-binding protein G(s) subunit alpha isoforms XLas-like isoform X2 [Hirundo rustica]